jgi:hypothetical protein
MSKGKERPSTSPASAAQAPPATGRKLIRFNHLKERGICQNRERLAYLIEHQNFPPGFWLGPNTRVWWDDVVEAWLETCPTERPATNQAHPPRQREDTSDSGGES